MATLGRLRIKEYSLQAEEYPSTTPSRHIQRIRFLEKFKMGQGLELERGETRER